MNNTQKNIRCLLRFRENAKEGGIPKEQHDETLRTMAEALSCASDDIRVIETQEEGRLLTLEMAGALFERLLKLDEADEQGLRKLGVLLVKEILDEPYDLSRVRRMLGKIFSDEELRSFCEQYFPDVSSKLSSSMKKTQIIDALMDFARQTSRVPHILVLAEQRHAELFKKHEPYYLPVRIFPKAKKQQVSQTSSFKAPFFNLTLVEFFRASLLGSGLAAGLTFLLQRVMMSASDAFLNYLLMGGIALIGMFTGEAVLKLANHKRGKFLAIVSVGSYLVGSVLGNSLLIFSLIGFQFSPGVLINVLVGGVASLISLAVLIGIFLAYKYTR